MGAQLASALDLRVPEACLLEITPEFAATVPNPEIAEIMKRSIGWNFGSRKLPPGYTNVLAGRPLLLTFRATAAEIFAFDGIIQNPDRRVSNPNCLTNGSEMVILDHELAFSFLMDIFPQKPPWDGGNVSFLRDHVFFEPLRQTPVSFDRLAGAVDALKYEHLARFTDAVPLEWAGGKDAAGQILEYILLMKRNILPTLEAIKTILR